MADAQLKKKVYGVLKEGYFNDPDDAVDISDGPEDSIHLVIFSRKFTGTGFQQPFQKNGHTICPRTEYGQGGVALRRT